jgi:hypothetical protein
MRYKISQTWQLYKFLFVDVTACDAPMPPLPKGRWPGEAGSEGFCGKMLRNNGISAKTYCGNNPPVTPDGVPAPFRQGGLWVPADLNTAKFQFIEL